LVWRCRLRISSRLGGCKCWLFVTPSTLVVCDVPFTTMGHNLWSLMAFTLATKCVFNLSLLRHNFSEDRHFTWVVLAVWQCGLYKWNHHFIYCVQLPNVFDMPTLTIIIFHTLYPNKKL
jgi:hypothetical protein